MCIFIRFFFVCWYFLFSLSKIHSRKRPFAAEKSTRENFCGYKEIRSIVFLFLEIEIYLIAKLIFSIIFINNRARIQATKRLKKKFR